MIELNNPLMINAVEPGTDQSGRAVVKLWHGRLKHAALIAREPELLMTIGIDPTELRRGRNEAYFLAYWKYSQRTNDKGNPHRDVIRLESLTPPAASDHETAALLRQVIAGLVELRQMMIQAGQTPPAESVFDYFYANGDMATIPEEKTAFNDYRRANAEKVPTSRDALRQWVRERKASPPAEGKPATAPQRTGGKIQPPIEYHRKGQINVPVN